ncbi:MAG: diguanylate cyclase [Acidimicrobiia bacterium]
MPRSRPGDADVSRALRAIDQAPGTRCALIGPEMTTVWATDALAATLGYRPGEFIGHSVLEFLHPGDLAVVADAIGAQRELTGVLSVGRGVDQRGFDVRVRANDGEWIRFECTAGNFFDDPAVNGLLIHLRPVNERTDLRMAVELIAKGVPLQESLALLADHADAMRTDRMTAIVHWNDDEPVAITRLGRVEPDGTDPEQLCAELVDEVLWSEVRDWGIPVSFLSLDALDAPIADAARRLGFESLVVEPLIAPASDEAIGALVVWRRHGGAGRAAVAQVAPMMERLAVLAIATDRITRTLRHRATTDHLTGLANRSTFERRTADCLEAGTAVIYIDLDDFKPVNDRYGHHAGDTVLAEIGTRIGSCVRATDVVARIGGDEFAVLCPSGLSLDEIVHIGHRIVNTASRPIDLGNDAVTVGASVGIAVARAGDSLVEVLRRADRALYAAKAAGKGDVRLAA